MLKAAYEAGVKDHDLSVRSLQKQIATSDGTVAIRSGKLKVSDNVLERLSDEQRETLSVLRGVSLGIGTDIFVVTDEEFTERFVKANAKALYERSSDRIYIPLKTVSNSKESVMYALTHELVHAIREWSPKEYDKLVVFVSNQLQNGGERHASFAEMIAEKMDSYKNGGVVLTAEEAIEEVVAESFNGMLENSTALETLAKENRTLFEKICATVEEFFEKLSAAIQRLMGQAPKNSVEYLSLLEAGARVEEMQKLFDEVLINAVHTRNSRVQNSAEKNTVDDDGVKYSIEGGFEEQVEKVINNKYDRNNHVYMGETPESLIKILGLKQLPVLLTNNHVYSMAVSAKQAKADGRYDRTMHYHNLGIDLIKKLPQALNEPAAIIKASTNKKDLRFVVVTNLTDKNNHLIIAAFQPFGKGFHYNVEIDSNVLLSGYGKNIIENYLETAKDENRLLYVNKKSSQRSKNTPGVQFSDTILSADYNNSLSQYKQIVNSKYMQNEKNIHLKRKE